VAGGRPAPEPWHWAVQTNLARALVAAGRAAEAYEVCVALGAVLPTLPEAHQLAVRTTAGVALALTGDFARAYTEFEQGALRAPRGGAAGRRACVLIPRSDAHGGSALVYHIALRLASAGATDDGGAQDRYAGWAPARV